jgi:hypothetical protein
MGHFPRYSILIGRFFFLIWDGALASLVLTVQTSLALNLLCSPDLSQTHNLPASAPWMLELQAGTTTSTLCSIFWICNLTVSWPAMFLLRNWSSYIPSLLCNESIFCWCLQNSLCHF